MPPAHANVVLVGEADAGVVEAASALGLGVWRVQRPRAVLQTVHALRRPAVILAAHLGHPVVRELARIRLGRDDQRLLVRADGTATLPVRPPGIDELLDARASSDELLSRIVIHLAHARAAASRYLPVAEDTVLDLESRALRRRGRLIQLRPMESRLLEELARSPGRALSREWLLARAWPRTPAQGTRTVDVHVRWLRQKLESDPSHPIHLLTVRGLGYQLEPDGETMADARAAW